MGAVSQVKRQTSAGNSTRNSATAQRFRIDVATVAAVLEMFLGGCFEKTTDTASKISSGWKLFDSLIFFELAVRH
jgi:hypothetical protein